MRFDAKTYRLDINLSNEAHARLAQCINGIGLGMFVEIALDVGTKMNVQPPADFHPAHRIYPQVATPRAEQPAVLGGRLAGVLERLHPPIRPPAEREELIFDLPKESVLKAMEWALREGWTPHESLGEVIETALRNIEHRMEGLDQVQSIGAPVDPALRRRVYRVLHGMKMDPDAVVASEFVEVIRKRQP
jgi:hypothetical protein